MVIVIFTLGFIAAIFLITIAIIRWALRVNDIVDRLDKIVELLSTVNVVSDTTINNVVMKSIKENSKTREILNAK
jgi:uncharacterized membrane protein